MVGVEVAEALGLLPLLGEELDHGHALNGFLEEGVQPGQPHPNLPVGGARPGAEEGRGNGEDRDHGEGDER